MRAIAPTGLPPTARRLIADFAYLVAGHGFVRLVGFVGTLYIAQTLGPAEFGKLSLGIAVSVVFAVCANLGLEDLIVRQIVRAPDAGAALVGDAVVLKLLVLPVGAVAAVALTMMRPQDGLLWLWLLLYASLYSYLLVIYAVCRGRRRVELQALLSAFQILLVAAVAALAARFTGRAAPAAAGYALATVVALGAGIAVLGSQRALPRLTWRPAQWATVLRTTLPFAATMVCLMAFDRLAIIAVTVNLGQTAAGWFGAAYNVVLGAATIPGLAIVAVFPALARAASERRDDRRAVAAVVLPLLAFGAVSGTAAAGVLHWAAPILVPRLLGTAYVPSISVLQTLAGSVPFLFLAVALASVLEAIDRQRAAAAGTGAVLLVAAPLCFQATRVWGIGGAATAYTLSYVLLAGVLLALVAGPLGWTSAGARSLRLPRPATTWRIAPLGRAWPRPPFPAGKASIPSPLAVAAPATHVAATKWLARLAPEIATAGHSYRRSS